MPFLRNIATLATCRAAGKQDEIHAIQDAALVWEKDRILWVGPERDLPPAYLDLPAWDAGGRLVIPGLVDCHTHLAFGGWRADEFVERLRGASYLEIAARGGGILRTVEQTRALSAGALLERALGFLAEIKALGVTSVECKSGYGLDLEAELRILNVYRKLQALQPLRVVPTFLGAHVVPPEFRSERERYLELLEGELIPEVARRGLARFCDVFVEESAFTPEEGRRILETGLRFGLRPKVHADQLSDGGGARLAAEVGAVSADHLESVSEDGVLSLVRTGVVAVSLPLASLYLDQAVLPARRLIAEGVAVAVATDFNPGSAPSFQLPLALLLACTRQRMTPAEVLKGSTLLAARALDLEHEIGSLEAGKAADFALIDAPDVDHWLYHFRANACLMTVAGGKVVYDGRSHQA